MAIKTYSIGHFINQPANPTEFEILEFNKMDEPNVDDFHKHTFYEIIWTDAGVSKQFIDYQHYTVQPNSLFFISPNQVHHFEEWKPLTGGTILFTEDFFLLNQNNKDKLFELSFLDNFYAHPCLQLKKSSFIEIKTTINELLREQHRPDKNETIIQSLLYILVARIQRCIDSKNERAIPKRSIILFKEFKRLLEIHYEGNTTPSYFAERLNISSHHLNLISKSVSGKTASEVIRERRILEVKRLLTFTNQTVSEIAFNLNFIDSSYLAKIFKTEEKMSPLEFKTKMSEKYRIR
jgi:AraC family transcriptional regulator, transcriptional activator of pobA